MLDILKFEEGYFERIWGGDRLRSVLGKDVPEDKCIGEAWLVSDHASHESVVSEGPHVGRTLRELLEENAGAVLGNRAQLTVHGRFPLLLKILDAGDVLSVQVHPDDAAAARLGEPDVGKTEMWHVLESDSGSELICGLKGEVTPDNFLDVVEDGQIAGLMKRLDAAAGTNVYVAAGTVHAIGGGILLAEIQQNSDLTYRIFDWERRDSGGNSRELHLEKARAVTHFGAEVGSKTSPLSCRLTEDERGAGLDERLILAGCRYFCSELTTLNGCCDRQTRGDSFHLILGKAGRLEVSGEISSVGLSAGQAVLVPGCLQRFSVSGEGVFLDYYVPNLGLDVVGPLQGSGHADGAIGLLGEVLP